MKYPFLIFSPTEHQNTNTNNTNSSELVGIVQVRRYKGVLRKILDITHTREREAALLLQRIQGDSTWNSYPCSTWSKKWRQIFKNLSLFDGQESRLNHSSK